MYDNISGIQTLRGVWPAKNIGIIQSTTRDYPDIDLINLSVTNDSPLQSKNISEDPKKDTKLIVPRRTFSPYNDQATLHLYPALWTLLLPITIDHQLTDIYRSYIMQVG